MKQKTITLLALLLITVQYMWAWDGSGTQTDPYKIQNSADWHLPVRCQTISPSKAFSLR